MIKTAQRLGFTLAEVADLIDTGTHRHGKRPEPGLHARVTAKLAEVEQKIADLTVIADSLRSAVAVGCDDLVTCANSPCCPLPFTELAGRDPCAEQPADQHEEGQEALGPAQPVPDSTRTTRRTAG